MTDQQGLPAESGSAPLRGACLCGAVRYTLDAAVGTLSLCHCAQCRAAGGGIVQPVIVAEETDVAFDNPPEVTEYQSSPGKFRAFCSACGAPVYSRRDDVPGVLRLRAGLIADLPEPAELKQQFRGEAWSWLPRLAGLLAQEEDGTA